MTSYILGHAENERRRLVWQGGLVARFTDEVLRQAGLENGMRVLDIGCGMGDVTLLAAELVGSGGLVVGVDRDAGVLRQAARRADDLGFTHVRFTQAVVDEMGLGEKFDAVVGRFVLMYQPDPAATVRACIRQLKPGGVVAFVESDSETGGRSMPSAPLYQKCQHWIRQTLRRAGVCTDMGLRLAKCFHDAGLGWPGMRCEAGAGAGREFFGHDFYAETIRTLLPHIEGSGVAEASEIDVDSLAERLRAEADQTGSEYVTTPVMAAWARTAKQL